MQYKVLSASLELDEKIYKQGDYIEIESKKVAEELSSFGCILIENVKEVEPVKEAEKVVEAPKMPKVNVVKGKKKEVNMK